MPQELPPLESLTGYVRSLAGLGRRPALIEQHLYRTTTYTYAELLGRAFAFRAELARRGIHAGDRVMLWGASGAAWAIAFYGCLLACAVVVPLDDAFSPAFAARVREQTEAVLLCSDHEPPAGTPRLTLGEILALGAGPPPADDAAPPPETLLEIVYTSGATAEPKGVMITHGNLLANLRPIAGEIGKYKRYAGVALPLRFLHLIPLSHLFGQVMGLMIPPLVDSATVYPESQAPAQWALAIRRHRASVMVAVPQQIHLFSQWMAEVAGIGVEAGAALGRNKGIAWSWWRWRRLHQRLGWKMWAFVSGGAALTPVLEDFLNAMGYAVIQGYGLTETAPAIAVTHPFKIQRGAVGRLLAGVETRLAPDGEILVRGGNVSPGYYRNSEATRQTFGDGWLHTGDLGRLDEAGNLHFLGRKKEMIVTSDGLNVFPEDVERALAQRPEVAESAVVERRHNGTGQVHAVVVLRPPHQGGELDAVVAATNAGLEPHQRIRSASLWPQTQLPRTASTRKLQRTAIARWVNQNGAAAPEAAPAGGARDWKDFVEQRWGMGAERLRPEARLDADLGLSSLDRVELWNWVEAHTPGGLDESQLAVAATVADVDGLFVSTPGTGNAPAPGVAAAPAPLVIPADEKTWPMRADVRQVRRLAFATLVFPFLRRAVSRVRVEGAEQFDRLQRPIFFVANHQSMLDVPLILKAMPRSWRPWVAPAMGIDPVAGAFDSRARPWRRFRDRWRLRLMRLIFNAYILSPQGAVAATLRQSGRLADAGYCPLIFPEGRRTPDGRMHAFRPGIGVFIAALRIPVMAVRIEGLYEILPDGATRAKRGPASVQFGPVFHFADESAEEITAKLAEWYKIAT